MAEEVENKETAENSEGTENLKVLENIDVNLTVEVGRTEITIRDLLRLNEGSVVELDRLAGDPLDIMVNNTKIAKGEVVMVGERFGVRFGEIVDPENGFNDARGRSLIMLAGDGGIRDGFDLKGIHSLHPFSTLSENNIPT